MRIFALNVSKKTALLLLAFLPLLTSAQIPYLNVSTDGSVLTLNYGKVVLETTSTGTNYDLSYLSKDSDFTKELRARVKKVVFEDAFILNVQPATCAYWFADCKNLAKIEGNLQDLDLSGCSSTVDMFNNCASLTSIDMRNWNTSNITKMTGMFEGCSSLKSLDISHFNTANVDHFADMFRGCTSLTTLSVGDFITSNRNEGQDYEHMCEGVGSESVPCLLNLGSYFETNNNNDIDFYSGNPYSCIWLKGYFKHHFVTIINDQADYSPVATPAGETVDVILNRKLSNDLWNTFVMPFDASEDQMNEAFPDGYQMAMMDTYDGTTIKFKNVKDLVANYPVLLKPAKTVESVTFNQVKIEVSDYIAHTLSSNPSASFIGTYDAFSVIDENGYYIYNTAKDGSTDSYHGKLVRSKGTARIYNTRAYFRFSNLEANNSNSNSAKAFLINTETTKIDNIVQQINTHDIVYNLQGQRVNKDYQGIIINQGRKYINR